MSQGWKLFDLVIPGFCGMGMHLRLDGFRLVYTCIAILMWTVSGIFSREYMSHYKNKMRYYLFFWATFFATVGVFWSADLFTTFIFFEIMSFTSYVWVAFDERKPSLRAAETYLAVAVIGGMVMLMGLFLLYDLLGTLEMDAIGPLAEAVMAGKWPLGAGNALSAAAAEGAAVSVIGGDAGAAVSVIGGADGPTSVWVAAKVSEMPWGGNMTGLSGSFFPTAKAQLYTAAALMLFGFGAKAGCFPLHIWLPKAHPEAPAPASALLSGILTKTGVFGIIVVSCVMFGSDHAWGLLIAVLGLITMFLGALLAVFSTNLKRTLACSSVSQIGFILTGIGMACLLRSVGEGNSLAVRGAFLHMMNHSLFKLVLFLCAGAVYMNLHQLELDDIRGFGRNKPVLMFAFLMGALGIGGIPLWNGYISKTLIHESIVEYMEFVGGPLFWHAAEWVFLITGGMTVSYMLKLFVALFVDKHPTRQAEFDALCSSAVRSRGAGASGAVAGGAVVKDAEKGGKVYMNAASGTALAAAAALCPILGLTPHITMDNIARLGESFFHMEGHAHEVAYFSFANLKGGLISIGIGIFLYAVVIRGLLMEKEGEGRHYVNRWPQWLDLENLVYRPVLQVALPAICGTACAMLEQLLSVVFHVTLVISTVFSRFLDSTTDGVVRLARLTTHSQIKPAREAHDTDLAAHVLGAVLDGAAGLKERLSPERRRAAHMAAAGASGKEEGMVPVRESASLRLVRGEEQIKHIFRLVETSFSFGLMLFCIGLCITLGYLLFMFFGR